MILDFRFQPHKADALTTPSGAVQKVISQTPSPLRGTPSINRGRVEILPVFVKNHQLLLCSPSPSPLRGTSPQAGEERGGTK